jgi:hypothetical protein
VPDDLPAPRREPLSEELRQDLFGRASFVPVFFLALLTVMGFPIADNFHWGFLITVPLLAGTILLAFHRSQVGRRFLHAASLVVVVAGAGSLAAASAIAASGVETRWLLGVTSALMAGLILLALPAIMRQTFRHRKVTINTLAAGVTAYLFIGFFFTALYRVIHAVEGVPFFTLDGNPEGGEYQYFSFVTLTTLGYGDYTPATDMGRAAAVLEAILGQVFLVTAVARIVSIMGQEQQPLGSLAPGGPPAIDPDPAPEPAPEAGTEPEPDRL